MTIMSSQIQHKLNSLIRGWPRGTVGVQEWLSSLDYLIENESPLKVQYILQQLKIRAQQAGAVH